jgi:hypothetical protein
MKMVNDGLLRRWVFRVAAWAVFGRKEGLPHWFNDPVDSPFRMCDAQSCHGGQRVQNVSHGAETDDKEAKLGLGLQTLIFSQGRAGFG